MKNTPFIIIMSKEPNIPIDADEMPIIVDAIRAKSSAKVRQGFFNPAYYISIVLDQKRFGEHLENLGHIGDTEEKYRLKQSGPQLLKDIFEGIEFKKNLLSRIGLGSPKDG